MFREIVIIVVATIVYITSSCLSENTQTGESTGGNGGAGGDGTGGGNIQATTNTVTFQEVTPAGNFIKNSGDFTTIAAGTPWTLEAVTSINTSTGSITLWNATDGVQIAASQIDYNTANTTPVLGSISFADNAAGFDDGDSLDVRLISGAGISIMLDRVGLWLELSQVHTGQVYYRMTRWQDFAADAANDKSRVNIDLGKFSNPLARFLLEARGAAGGGNGSFKLYDMGVTDTGTVGADIAGSSLAITTGNQLIQTSGNLTLTNGNRIILNGDWTSGTPSAVQGDVLVLFSE